MNKLTAGFLILIFGTFIGCKNQTETKLEKRKDLSEDNTEILMIGTFHYSNPGLDVAKIKSYDILGTKSQDELEMLTTKIKQFNPTKIFVEWDYDNQVELDSLYNLYKKGEYFLNDSLSDFYLKNEIFQLAFRVAKKANLDKVYAVDYYDVSMPFGKLPEILKKNNQDNLQRKMDETRALFESEFNNKVRNGASLIELMSFINSPRFKYLNDEYLNRLPLLAGTQDDFTGAKITSEWYRRNLFIWSLIQKNINKKDQRIMILFGGSHTSILSDLIQNNNRWKIIDFESLIE